MRTSVAGGWCLAQALRPFGGRKALPTNENARPMAGRSRFVRRGRRPDRLRKRDRVRRTCLRALPTSDLLSDRDLSGPSLYWPAEGSCCMAEAPAHRPGSKPGSCKERSFQPLGGATRVTDCEYIRLRAQRVFSPARDRAGPRHPGRFLPTLWPVRGDRREPPGSPLAGNDMACEAKIVGRLGNRPQEGSPNGSQASGQRLGRLVGAASRLARVRAKCSPGSAPPAPRCPVTANCPQAFVLGSSHALARVNWPHGSALGSSLAPGPPDRPHRFSCGSSVLPATPDCPHVFARGSSLTPAPGPSGRRADSRGFRIVTVTNFAI